MLDIINRKFGKCVILSAGVLMVTLILLSCITCKKNSDTPVTGKSPINLGGPEYSIASYNIRRTTTADADNRAWPIRRPLVVHLIKTYNFDVFGVQEPLGTQIDNIISDLPDYGRFGVSDHNDHAYQHQDIFYKKSRFTLLDSGKFWLAPGGPDFPPSDTTPWDNFYHTEVVTWGKFQDKAIGFQFYVFNAHFEPGAPVSQVESARLILAKTASIAGTSPVIFMGDLNVDQRSEAYSILKNSSTLKDTYSTAVVRSPVISTFNNWKTDPGGDSRIDHIFTSSHFQVKIHNILTDNYNKVLPSEHFPVLAGVIKKTP
ncbi:MAG TPA: endonuclease/exonuclease/phosphatase family protein [Sphingobacteriaceae bacterium]